MQVQGKREMSGLPMSSQSPFTLFTLFTPLFTSAKFMRPLRVWLQCQHCPANIFIQHREEEGRRGPSGNTHAAQETNCPEFTALLNTLNTPWHLKHISWPLWGSNLNNYPDWSIFLALQTTCSQQEEEKRWIYACGRRIHKIHSAIYCTEAEGL